MRIEYHRTLLADRVRNAAFHAALERLIVPGETIVADIGCGTGLLAFMASKLGAKRVYGVERADIGAVADKLRRHNAVKGVRLIAGHSTDLEPPEPVDLVISETLGNYPFEENIIETLTDARARWLKPGGLLIPSSVQQFVCPVVAERQFRELTIWDEVGYGLDFTPARRMGLNNIYVRVFEPADLLAGGAAAAVWDAVDLAKPAKTTRSGEAEWPCDKAMTIYGLASWWTADLAPGIGLATGPLAAKTHWEQLFLPALEPMTLAKGERLAVRLRSTTSYEDGTNVTWTLRRLDARGKELSRQALDLEKGFLP